jgi:HD-GYP domain-containing protein (c-di-GMP phosphodiesterase class II)
MRKRHSTWTQQTPATRTYVATINVIAITLLAALLLLNPPSAQIWQRVVFWTVLILLGHLGEFELTRVGRVQVVASAGFAVNVAAMVDLPPAGAMIAIGIGSLTWLQLSGGAPFYVVIFNRAMLALCAALGTFVCSQVVAMLGVGPVTLALVLASLVGASAYFVLNVLLIGTLTGLRSNRPIGRAWISPFGNAPGLLANYLALAVVGALILVLQRQIGALGLVLAFIPMATSYASLRQLASSRVMYQALLGSLVDSLDLRDQDTGGHTTRVASLAMRLGRKMNVRGRALDDLYAAALLHDIGKIGIPDSILRKPGKLDSGEWELMKKHPDMGAQLLETHPRLYGAVPAVRHHQERFDGTGYPACLVGKDIPVAARVITVADSFMAMVDGRPYRAAISPEAAYEELVRWAGKQFDPDVVGMLTPVEWNDTFAEARRS